MISFYKGSDGKKYGCPLLKRGCGWCEQL